jgi:hypothetical protein
MPAVAGGSNNSDGEGTGARPSANVPSNRFRKRPGTFAAAMAANAPPKSQRPPVGTFAYATAGDRPATAYGPATAVNTTMNAPNRMQ